MWRRRALATLTFILALILPLTVAAEDPPAPTSRHLYRVDSLPLAGLAEMVWFVNEYVPGAQTVPHTHPGLTLVTVLAGESTVRDAAGEKTYRVGESFVEVPGVVVVARNGGAVKSRLIASIVLPKGAAPSTAQPGAPSPAPSPAPTTHYLARADAFFPGEAYEVVQQVLDFAPGAQTPAHIHPGQTFVTVLEGEITFTTQGATKVYKVGESFVELPEVVGQARNAGSTQATVMATYLLPKGAPLSTPTSMPGTGGGGMAQRTSAPAVLLAALAIGGGLALGTGLELRRRRRRA